MSTPKCALCGCEMTVETDGTPMHEGRHWPDIDRVFCLKRQLDAANARIKRLEAGIELLRHEHDPFEQERIYRQTMEAKL